MAQNKLQDGDLSFLLGQDSNQDPAALTPGHYSRGMNVVNRGGVIQCRPGYRCLNVLPQGHLQGFAVLRPKAGPEVLVFGVEGRLYSSVYPFEEVRQLEDIQFSPTARQLFFKQVEKSVTVNSDGSQTFLPTPVNLLVIQDGGFAPAALFDGVSAEHQRGANKIPPGGPMEWIGDRLWVARGSSVYASDIGAPDSFTEAVYVNGIGSFIFPLEVTGMTKTLSPDNAQLLVFTRTSTHLLQAGVRDRSTWRLIENFQKILFPELGCVSERSIKAHYGLLWWYSEHGLVNLDAAANGYISSALPYQDAEMIDSKARLSQDLGGVACASYENYFLVSVPYADCYNKHTWCLDQTVTLGEAQREPVWNSFWTGTRPVEWITGEFTGRTRCLYISKDYDGNNRLWEAFMPDRLDNGCPITWWAETRGYNFSLPGKFKEIRYADVYLAELSGVVDVAVFWAGAHRGKYKRVMTKRIQATTDTFRPEQEIDANTQLVSLKKQSRDLRTQDGKAIIAEATLQSCSVESPKMDFYDDSFQFIIVGSGPGAVTGVVAYAEPPVNDDDSGRVEEDETDENFVRYDGGASHSPVLDEALAEFAENNPIFTSTKTVTLEQDGLTEVGVGFGSSIVSQQDADKIATAMANRLAAEALRLVLPNLVSMGDAANE